MRFILSLVLALSTLAMGAPAQAETQAIQQNRLKNALHMSGMDWGRAVYTFNALANTHYYDTAVELLAASPSDGRFGYAIDTDVLYMRVAGAWVGLGSGSGILGTNGGTIGNETNNVWTLAENSENLTLTYAADLVTFASGTSATLAFTPASAFAGDVTLNGGAGALTFGAASSSVVVPDNSGTALLIGSTGYLGLITIDTTDDAEEVNIVGKTAVSTFRVDTGFATFDEQAVLSAGADVNGDALFGSGAGAVTFDAASSSILLSGAADNAAAGLDIGSTGATSMLRFVTTDDAEKVQTLVKMDVGGADITESGTTDTSLNITQTLNDTGAPEASEDFYALKIDVTSTDITGWDSEYLIWAEDDTNEMFSVSLAGDTVTTGDATINGGAGAINVSSSGDSSVLVADNDSTAFVVGATGALDILGIDSTDGAEGVAVGGKLGVAGKEITESGASDTTLNLAQTLNDTGAVDAAENYTGVKLTLTETDTTGWASVYLMDLLAGSTSMLRVTSQGAVTSQGEHVAGGGYVINGDHKGFLILEYDGTAADYTANKINTVFLAHAKLNATYLVNGGAGTIAKAATGLNMAPVEGNITDNDDVTVYGAPTWSSGRPMVVGQDPAFQFCATIYFTDVSGSDLFYCGVRQAGEAAAADAGYTEFAAIGHVSGAMYTIDEDGADADGTDTWSDTTAKSLCTLVSAAGVVTYTNDGAAPTNPGAQTLTDGLMVEPFCQLRHDTDKAEDTIIMDWSIDFTQP